MLIPLIGKEQALSLLVALQLMTSLIIGVHMFYKTRQRVSRWIPLMVPALLGLVLVFPLPHWDRKMLSIGKYHRLDRPEITDVG